MRKCWTIVLNKPHNFSTGYALICSDWNRDYWSILEVNPVGSFGKREYRGLLEKKGFAVPVDKLFQLTKERWEGEHRCVKQLSLFDARKEIQDSRNMVE